LIYRAEIDGLRTVAVLSVILYHAQILLFGQDRFTGGFIGVDIFFVISGYLITRIILKELFETGSFSILHFYERRARRILPALLIVMLVSFPFAWQRLLPSAFIEYSQSVLSAVFFGSNVFFYFTTTEYGAANALLKPFLHTWSLGIEEQFYIIFPILLMGFYRFLKRHVLALILVMLLLSLLFADAVGGQNTELNFYLPFSRFWELLTGSVLAYSELKYGRPKRTLAATILSVVGLGLIAYSVLFFDDSIPHPGLYTVIPVLGVALVIALSSDQDRVGQVLGSKPLVGIGLISYSAYLWHFPIFAFARINNSQPSNLDKTGWIILVMLLSAVSYVVIEKPFRSRRLIKPNRFLLSIAALLLSVIVLNLVVVFAGGFNSRYEGAERGLANYERDNQTLREQSWTLWEERFKTEPDFRADDFKVLILGNSHSKSVYNMLAQNSGLYDRFDFLRYGETADIQLACFDENNEQFKRERRDFYNSSSYIKSDLVLISTRYRKQRVCTFKRKNDSKSSDLVGLESLLERFEDDNKAVIVFGNTIEFHNAGWQPIVDNELDKQDITRLLGDPEAVDAFIAQVNALYYLKKHERTVELNKEIEEITARHDVAFFEQSDVICELEKHLCFGFTDTGDKAFYDGQHPTLGGAKFFGKRLYDMGFKQQMRLLIEANKAQ
jgi:peptidoglycan/LPS O-acetylase OafA/YrhL